MKYLSVIILLLPFVGASVDVGATERYIIVGEFNQDDSDANFTVLLVGAATVNEVEKSILITKNFMGITIGVPQPIEKTPQEVNVIMNRPCSVVYYSHGISGKHNFPIFTINQVMRFWWTQASSKFAMEQMGDSFKFTYKHLQPLEEVMDTIINSELLPESSRGNWSAGDKPVGGLKRSVDDFGCRHQFKRRYVILGKISGNDFEILASGRGQFDNENKKLAVKEKFTTKEGEPGISPENILNFLEKVDTVTFISKNPTRNGFPVFEGRSQSLKEGWMKATFKKSDSNFVEGVANIAFESVGQVEQVFENISNMTLVLGDWKSFQPLRRGQTSGNLLGSRPLPETLNSAEIKG